MVGTRRIWVSILFACLLVLTGCQSACNRGSHNDSNTKEDGLGLSNGAAAVVNGVSLSAAELDALHKRAVMQFARSNRPVDPEMDRKMRGSILRKMIDDELLKQKAEKEGVKVDRTERVEALEKYKEKVGGSKGFEVLLSRQNLTEEQMLKSITADLQKDKLIQKLSSAEAPSEEEIKTHYLANQRFYTLPEMVRARHILVKLSPNDPKEKGDLALKKAHQILQEASLPNASFEALVQKYSEGPSAKSGGDLGFFARGKMVKSFDDAAFSAPLKKPVGPIKTDFGYHIIYVEEKSPPKVAPLEEVHDRVVELLKRSKRAQKSEEILYTLRKAASVKINDPSLTKEEYNELSERDKIAAQSDKAEEKK